MLTRFSCRNFKVFDRVDVGLERLTAIVGPNASGKTSLLQGIHFLTDFDRQKPKQVVPQPLVYHRRGSEWPMELACRTADGGNRWVFKLAPFHGPTYIVNPVQQADETYWQWTGGDWRQVVFNPATVQDIGPSLMLDLDPSVLALPIKDFSTEPTLGKRGAGLNVVLSHLKLSREDLFRDILNQLKTIIPSLINIRFRKIEKDDDFLTTMAFDFQSGEDVPPELVSEGTLLVLGLITAISGEVRPKILLIDDVDHGIHPKAQLELVDLLRRFLDLNPNSQVIMTTHSPYLVDSLRSEEVLLTTLKEDGTAAVAPLTAHPDFERWKHEMSPGELWSLFGEKWAASVGS